MFSFRKRLIQRFELKRSDYVLKSFLSYLRSHVGIGRYTGLPGPHICPHFDKGCCGTRWAGSRSDSLCSQHRSYRCSWQCHLRRYHGGMGQADSCWYYSHRVSLHNLQRKKNINRDWCQGSGHQMQQSFNQEPEPGFSFSILKQISPFFPNSFVTSFNLSVSPLFLQFWVLITVVSMSTVSVCWFVWYVCSAVLSWAKQ